MAAKKLKVKKRSGGVAEYPTTKIKDLFKSVGFTGNLLLRATGDVFKEAKKLTTAGVLTVTGFEKAVVKAVNNTNKIAMNTAQKTVKKILK